MKIAVVGAGIIGVTTAYELAADGHAVTVFERRGTVAEEASFSHAGMLGPGYVAPAPAPAHTGLRLSMGDMGWLYRRRRATQPARYKALHAAMQRLAQASREQRRDLVARLGLETDQDSALMLLFRTESDARHAQLRLQALRDAGVQVQDIAPEVARKLELALNPDTAFFGAAYLQNDEVGNCRQFALLLRNAAQALGARFQMGSTVAALASAAGGPVLQIAGGAAPQTFDAVVVCTGAATRPLLASAGIRLPVAEVWGYALNAQIREPLNAPRNAVLDMRHQICISCVGHRVRVSGGAEMGMPPKARDASLQRLYKALHDWFPGAARVHTDVQEWRAAQPMLPDGAPAIGASSRPGIWINTGHGASGWALACGSARRIADQIAGRAAANTSDLAASRFG